MTQQKTAARLVADAARQLARCCEQTCHILQDRPDLLRQRQDIVDKLHNSTQAALQAIAEAYTACQRLLNEHDRQPPAPQD